MTERPELRPKLPVIGWREWLALPDIGVEAIKVKIDTGARTSAIHAFDVEVFGRRGMRMVRFLVHPFQRSTERSIVVVARVVDERIVRSSNGTPEPRLVIVTDVELLGQRWPIELTLARRDQMGFRMLLGRQALRKRFLVDPSRSFVGGKPGRRRPRQRPRSSRS